MRTLLSLTRGRPTSDGAGVRLTRVFGGAQAERFDPFLMLDEFGSDDPDAYIAGFPPHPHRGFETVTYMLAGHMRHEDHLGNVGQLESGGVQWMTAARGVIHSEMPQQSEGLLRGFQLWLNLPARDKLGEPAYRDFAAADIPHVRLANGVEARVIAGHLRAEGIDQAGAVQRPVTDPQFYDLHLPAGGGFAPRLADGYRTLLYVYEGAIELGEGRIATAELAQLSDHGPLTLRSRDGAKVLLLAGQPLREPIVQYGPFVMNSREGIEQALRDSRDGRLAS